MQLSSSYEKHVEIVKELKMHSDFTNSRAEYKDDFEKIYNEAKEEKVNLSNAKEFLNSLSEDELSTIQHYAGLADPIKTGNLSNEGAYNLLVHHYERFDFDQNGMIDVGIGKTSSMIPVNMPDAEKKALVASLNEMDESERFQAMFLISLPNKVAINDNGEISPVYDNTIKDYDAILEMFDRIINPEPMSYTSSELKSVFSKFKELFEKHYEEQKDLKNSYQAQTTTSTQAVKAKLS
ncbi:hypothetical protein CRV01_04230 [Arcobacter sp. CECT 8983]|uniref:hypothetical protein n=1 Tax=Arcobacter sp. CECT 8983 TaxID=2044508 RepID=UPI00100C2B69|nr:hypothetical protein [Arcobacter sp. CECT 8983]RXJ90372.1 hypothetical protein CRV01_04230 [Arcobacter sp. CECT 8983]